MPKGRFLTERLRRFASAEEGGMTILALFLLMGMLMIAGIAIDTNRLQARATLLQVTADAAAYAAAEKLVLSTAPIATAAALQSARINMPPEEYGNVVTYSDVELGTWNPATLTFAAGSTGSSGKPNAVRVTARQSERNGNPFQNILLGWVGVGRAEPARVSVVAMFIEDRGCEREGFLTPAVIDLQSNNEFYNGFCIHSNTGVQMNSNNFFQGPNGSFDRVTVSMPVAVPAPAGNLTIPSSGFTSNPGLEAALKSDSYSINMLTRLPLIIESLRSNPQSPFLPDYITIPGVRDVNPTGTINNSSFTSKQVHHVTCGSGGSLNLPGSIRLREVVIWTNCAVDIATGAELEDVIIATTSTRTNGGGAVSLGSGARIGKSDGCANDGGAQILAMGDVSMPANPRLNGVQIVSNEMVEFTANLDGGDPTVSESTRPIAGISIVARMGISGTSNMTVSGCGGRGMNDNIKFPTIRPVM